jgi:hypothetical protein
MNQEDVAGTATANNVLQRWIRFCLGHKGLWFLIFLLFATQFLGPVIDSPLVKQLTALLFSLFLVAGVFSLSPRPAVRMIAGALVVAAIILRWLRLALPTPAIIGWGLTISLLFMIFLTLASIRQVFRDDRAVTGERVTGAVAVYLLFGLTFAYLYALLDQSLPGAFSLTVHADVADPAHMESFTYFSFITLTTLGYGDITPVHPAARMFVSVEALFGQLYPATLLARLVSLEIANRQTSRPAPSGEER